MGIKCRDFHYRHFTDDEPFSLSPYHTLRLFCSYSRTPRVRIKVKPEVKFHNLSETHGQRLSHLRSSASSQETLHPC